MSGRESECVCFRVGVCTAKNPAAIKIVLYSSEHPQIESNRMLMGLVFLPSSSYLRECDSKAFTMSTLLHIGRPGISSEIMGIRLQNRRRSKKFISFRCGPTKNDDELSPSEEAAESMFMKELRRRGMESEDQRKTTESKSNGEPSSDYDDKKLENQREVSMSLNSEGLEVR